MQTKIFALLSHWVSQFYDPHSKAKVERLLRWESDAFASVAAGFAPLNYGMHHLSFDTSVVFHINRFIAPLY